MYDNMWDKCVLQHCRSKVKVTDAILGKTCHGSSAFIIELTLIKLDTNVNYDNMSAGFYFSFVYLRSRSQLHIAEAFITLNNCLFFMFFFFFFFFCGGSIFMGPFQKHRW